MFIEVTNVDTNEVIFEGEAEVFLERMEYDELLEDFLVDLDEKDEGEKRTFYGDLILSGEYIVEKLSNPSLYD